MMSGVQMDKKNSGKYNRSIRNTRNVISIIFLCIISLAALTFAIYIMLKNVTLKRDNEAYKNELEVRQSQKLYNETQLQQQIDAAVTDADDKTRNEILGQLQTGLEAGDGAINTIRKLYPDSLIIGDSDKYIFTPIDRTIPANPFSETDFELDDNDIMHYVGTGTDIPGTLGVDVSKFNGDIDWKKVAAAGVKYTYIRVGARGSSVGKINLDEKFEDNIKKASDNGISVGVYFYSQAVNIEEVKEEAQFVLDTIEPYDISYPVVFDLEKSDSENARTLGVSKEDFTKMTITFCDMIDEAGYTPMIYGNIKTFTLMLNPEAVTDYDKWIAYYDLPQYFPYEFSTWQYTSVGKIDGIDGNVDLNISVKAYD